MAARHLNPIDQLRHDIRGRLNALKLCVSALAFCDTPEETMEYLENIESAAGKIDELTGELDAVLPSSSPQV